jgi:hypothetical protein
MPAKPPPLPPLLLLLAMLFCPGTLLGSMVAKAAEGAAAAVLRSGGVVAPVARDMAALNARAAAAPRPVPRKFEVSCAASAPGDVACRGTAKAGVVAPIFELGEARILEL